MKAEEIRALSQSEREQKLVELKQSLFNLRFQKGIGQLENPTTLKKTQKDIARINTVIAEMARNPKEANN
jgi:large subunit ribosomal protein L29